MRRCFLLIIIAIISSCGNEPKQSVTDELYPPQPITKIHNPEISITDSTKVLSIIDNFFNKDIQLSARDSNLILDKSQLSLLLMHTDAASFHAECIYNTKKSKSELKLIFKSDTILFTNNILTGFRRFYISDFIVLMFDVSSQNVYAFVFDKYMFRLNENSFTTLQAIYLLANSTMQPKLVVFRTMNICYRRDSLWFKELIFPKNNNNIQFRDIYLDSVYNLKGLTFGDLDRISRTYVLGKFPKSGIGTTSIKLSDSSEKPLWADLKLNEANNFHDINKKYP